MIDDLAQAKLIINLEKGAAGIARRAHAHDKKYRGIHRVRRCNAGCYHTLETIEVPLAKSWDTRAMICMNCGGARGVITQTRTPWEVHAALARGTKTTFGPYSLLVFTEGLYRKRRCGKCGLKWTTIETALAKKNNGGRGLVPIKCPTHGYTMQEQNEENFMPIYRYAAVLNNDERTVDVLQSISEPPYERVIDVPKDVIIEGDFTGIPDETEIIRIPVSGCIGAFDGKTPRFHGPWS